MKKTFTVLQRVMLLALALGTSYTSRAQIIPQPVAVTGFNADIVANGSGNTNAGSSSNSSVDANSYVFHSNDYTTTTAPGFFHPNVGLPFGRAFLGAGTATPAVQYQLQPYSGNNTLRLYGVGGTASPVATAVGTLTLTTPAPAGTLYVLATCGSGTDATTALVNFADGTSQSFSFTVQDWFGGTPYAFPVSNRVLVTGTNFDALTANVTAQNPRLYQYALTLSAANAGKNITSIRFTKSTTAGSYVQIMAISAAPGVTYTPMALTFPAAGPPAANTSGTGTTAFGTPSSNGQDIIVNGTGNTVSGGPATSSTPYTNTSATADTDGAGYFLMASTYNGSSATYGLPLNGLLSSLTTSGLTYQLADYNNVNALQIRGVGSGMVTFTPTAATEVYVLTTSTPSATTTGGAITVGFSDGTSHSYSVSYPNWFSTASTTASQTAAGVTVGVNAKGRLQPGNTVQTSTTQPYLYENKLLLDPSEYSKTVTGITVTTPSTFTGGVLSVLGVTLNTPSSAGQCSFAAGHSATASVATACAGTTFNLNVLGLSAALGYTYQWQYSANNASWTNLTTNTSASPYSTSPTAALCPVLNQTGATYYRCLVQCAFDQAGTNSPSASIQVGQTDPINCYPYPNVSSSGCTAAGSVTGVQIAELATSAVVMNKTGLSCATTTEPYSTYGIFRDANSNGTLDKTKDYKVTVAVSNSSRLGVWMDLNRDGVFNSTANSAGTPTGEYFGTTNLTTSTGGTLILNIPATALGTVTNGIVGLRVRTESGSASVLSTAANSNATTVNGLTLDYAVVVTGATPCAGAPTATAPTASASTACPSTTFTLTAQGPALGTTGLTYQWEYKLSSGSTWASVPATITDVNGNAVATNSTAATLTIVNQRAATDYRVTITCTSSGGSATSPAAPIAQSALANCYCQNANNATNEYLTNVTLNAINNTSGSSQSNTPTGYVDYTASPTATQTTNLNRGGTYTLSATALSASTTPTEMVWIDYDQSGTFDPSEYTLIGTQSSTGSVTGSVSITIPATALLGDTRMRVRMHNDASGTSSSACTNAWNGETEDYRITIGGALVCSGTPPTTVASTTATMVCGGTSFTLSATGIAAGTTGLTYQWQSSPATAGTFTDISGATAVTYTVASQTAATDYRLVVTCTNSSLSANSNVVSVAQNAVANCYCQPSSSSVSEYLSNVTLGSINNSSGNSVASMPSGYTDYTASPTATQTTDLGRGTSYPVTITAVDNRAGSTAILWIDYDHSGTFDATNSAGVTEYLLVGTGPTSGTFPQTLTFTNTLAIPASALLGPTHLRVRWHNDATTAGNACTLGWNGETEEYLVNIIVPNTCTGTPAAATASASASTVCGGTSFTLSATGINTSVGGLTYQWQSSPAGAGTFSPISGATTNPYTVATQTAATDYRLVVTCTTSSLTSNSNVVSVAQNSFLSCYCTPTYSSGGGNDAIANVTLGTLSNTTSGNVSPYYHDYSATQNAVPTLVPGSNVTVSLTFGSDPDQYSAVWIDFNHSGMFEASEYFPANTNAGANGTASITVAVPVGALAGQTKMRVRGGDDSQPTSGQACGASNSNFGEAEDYVVNVITPLACTGTPAVTAATASAGTVCAGASFVLSATGIAAGTTGLTYQWQSSPAGAGTFADISGATTNPYTVASQTAATDYRLQVTCTASTQTTSSNVVAVGQNAFANCYCQPTSSSGGEYFTNVTLGSINNTTGSSTTTPISGYADYTANPTATQTTVLNLGSTYSLAVTAVDNRINSQALVWIDYNHSGTFEASEYTLVGSGPTTGTFPQTLTFTASITVPLTALTGPTHMRVRWHNDNNSTDPCGLGWNGETEEYLVTIASPVADLTVSTTATIPAGTYNNVTVTGTGNGTLTGATVVNGNLIVATGGTLHTACQPLTGSGTFMMAAGATLDICDPQGITLSGATGAIQLATRQFSVAGTYIYSGTAAQVTGSGLPVRVRNLTVNTSNGAALTLSQPVAIRRLLTLTSGNVLSGQNLTLRSDADSTALVSVGNGTVVGSATVQRYISSATNPGLGYRHFSAPVTNTTVADLATASYSPIVNPAYNSSATPGAVSPFPTVFGYTEARQATSPATSYSVFDRGWQTPTSTADALQSGKGYTVNLAGGQMVDFVGTLGTGNVALPLTRGTTTDAGWNLVGNPYPSTLNWDNVTIPAGMDAAVYVYQSASQYAGSYTSYTNGLGTSGGRTATIGMGQGFFVRVSPGTTATTLTLTNAARSTDFGSASNFQRGNDARPRIRLALESATSTLTDAAYVYFEAGATTGVDARYDAVKLANPTGLSLSAVAAGTDLAINGLPLASTATTVPLTVAVPQAGTYTLRADELLNLTNGPVYLLDALTGQQVDLLQQPSYSFSATGATRIAGRFSLGFPAAGPLATQPGLSAASVSVYPNPAHTSFTVLVPAVPGAKQVQMALFNSLGQRVREQVVSLGTTGAQATVEVKDLAAGIYTLRLQVAGQAAVARRVAVE